MSFFNRGILLFCTVGAALILVLTPSALASAAASSGVNSVYLPAIFTAPPTPTSTSTPVPTPRPTATPMPTATSTPVPATAQIVHTSSYVDSIGYTHFLGEVINNTGAPIYFVRITVSYFSSDGTVHGTDFTYTEASMIQNGEKAPFDDIQQPQAGWSYDTTSLSYETTDFVTYSHAFQLSGQNQYSDGFDEHYVGQITNVSGQPQTFVKVILTGYDGSGNVVLADFTYPNGSNVISPGATVPYDLIESSDRASLVQSASLIAEGQQ